MPATSREKAADQLEAMARAEFGELSAAEAKLTRAGVTMQTAFGGPSTREDDPSNNPEHASTWGRDREIRADLIRWLCINRDAKALVDPVGLNLFGVRVSGELDLSHADVPFPISMYNCRWTSPAYLVGCQIPSLNLQGTWTVGIHADGANFSQVLFLRNGFRADGAIQLVGAQVGANLEFTDGTFVLGADAFEAGADAIKANGVRVGGPVLLNRSRVTGTVNLSGANIGGDVDCGGAEFSNPPGRAITLDRAAVKGGIFFRADPGDKNRPFKATGIVDLTGATTSALVDEKAYWPDQFLLEGFVYGRIFEGPQDATSRLEWLKRDTSKSNQPYRQLAKVLEESGDTAGAMQVREALQAKLASHDWLPFRLLEQSIGYGYQPQNALWGLGGLTALGALLYWRADRMRIMRPSDKDAYASASLPSQYPRFQPFIFSLENTFPFVRLGQTEKWQPDPEARPVRHPRANALRRLLAWTASAPFLRWCIWIQILLGWLLATLFLAAISGIVQHG